MECREIDFGIKIARLSLTLNQCCLETPLKILFQQHRPNWDTCDARHLAAARGGRQLPRPEQLNVARRTLALSLRGWHGGQSPCRAQRGSPRRERPNSDVCRACIYEGALDRLAS